MKILIIRIVATIKMGVVLSIAIKMIGKIKICKRNSMEMQQNMRETRNCSSKYP